MNSGNQSLSQPLKARAVIARCRDLIKSGFDVPAAKTVLDVFVSSTLLFGSPCHDIHPKSQIVQNDLVQAIVGTYRCSSLARTHLALGLLRVKTAAGIRRIMSALKFRLSRLLILRTWIDSAIEEKWSWGQLVLSDLADFGITIVEWKATCAALDSCGSLNEVDRVLGSFKRVVRGRAAVCDDDRNREKLFDVALRAEIRPWHGIHPACLSQPARYGYIWLRDSFKAPHLLHGRDNHDFDDPCPKCLLPNSFKPSHILHCANYGETLILPGEPLSSAASRWNLHDAAALSQALRELKKRHLMALSHLSTK